MTFLVQSIAIQWKLKDRIPKKNKFTPSTCGDLCERSIAHYLMRVCSLVIELNSFVNNIISSRMKSTLQQLIRINKLIGVCVFTKFLSWSLFLISFDDIFFFPLFLLKNANKNFAREPKDQLIVLTDILSNYSAAHTQRNTRKKQKIYCISENKIDKIDQNTYIRTHAHKRTHT